MIMTTAACNQCSNNSLVFQLVRAALIKIRTQIWAGVGGQLKNEKGEGVSLWARQLVNLTGPLMCYSCRLTDCHNLKCKMWLMKRWKSQAYMRRCGKDEKRKAYFLSLNLLNGKVSIWCIMLCNHGRWWWSESASDVTTQLDINPSWPSDKNNAELDVYIRYFLFEVLPVYAYLDWIVS